MTSQPPVETVGLPSGWRLRSGHPLAPPRILISAAILLMLLDALRMVLLPAQYQTIVMDGFETFISVVCALLCFLTALRCSRFGRGAWALIGTFFVLTALADFHDFLAGVYPPLAASFPGVLEFLGWCTYLPLALLIFFPLSNEKDERPWNWLAIVDFLQVTLVVSAAYYRFLYVSHLVSHQGWAFGGRPEAIRNVLLSAGLLLRAGIDPSARARAFYRRAGGAFAAVTLFLIAFGANSDSISAWGRPAALLALGVFAASWKDIPDRQEEKRRLQWGLRLLPMLGPVMALLFIPNTPSAYLPIVQTFAVVSLMLFFLRACLSEYQRQASARLQHALYQISEHASRIEEPQMLYAAMHKIIGEMLYARNFYIALYDSDRQTVSFPYFVDERNPAPAPRRQGKGLTDYVLRTGAPLLALRSTYETLKAAGQVEAAGTPTVSWLGVPLVAHGAVVGAIVVQSYTEKVRYGNREKEVLTFVAQHVAGVIERRRGQDEVRASESRLRALMQHAPDAIVVWDAEDHRLIDVNESAVRLFGCTREELLRLGPQQFYAPIQPDKRPVAESFLENSERALAGGELRAARRIRTAQGQERLCELRLVALPSTQHRLLRGSFVDITDRQRAVEALQASEHRFRGLFEQAPVAMGMARNGVYIYVNRMFLRTFGNANLDEVVGRPVIEKVAPHCREKILEHIRLREEGHVPLPDEYETIGCRSDGSEFPLHVSATPVQLTDGPAVLAITTDISERQEAVEGLQASEQRFRGLIEQAPVAIGMARAGIYIYANPMYLRTFGYASLDEVVGHRVIEHVAPQCRQEIQEHVRRRDEGLVPLPDEYETIGCRKDGTLFPVQVAVTPVQLADGPAVLGFQTDISERKQAEEVLRDREARFRTLIEKAPVAIGISRNGLAIYTNQMFVEMFGYENAEELCARPVLEHWAPQYREAITEMVRRRSLGLPAPNEYEGIGLRKDGGPFPIHVAVTQVELLEGPATMAMMTNITERKQAEAAVRRSEAELRSFVENSPYGIARASLNQDRFLSANSALVKMLGYDSEAEVLALRLSTDVYCADEGSAGLLEAASPTERFNGIELQWMSRDGRRLTVRVSGRKGRSEHDDEAVLEFIVEDITEYYALHKQFLQAQKMEAVGRLAGGVAHDFNNVLGIIMGYTELLNIQLGEDHPACHNTEEIMKAARRAAALTQQLLAFSRKQVMQRKPLDLNALISDTDKMLRTLAGVGVRLVLRLEPSIPPIVADAGHLVQVLLNLAVNARDAMPEGGMLILATGSRLLDAEECRTRPMISPGNYVTITVTDTGTGIPAEIQQRIFEPFFTTKDESKGTGLGLATVYGIVQQSEGHIEVESEVGSGTSFRIFLPAAATGPALVIPDPAMAPSLRSEEGTILLVEDESALRMLLASALVKRGYTVLPAGSGAEALAVVAGGQHLESVITDFVLPDTKGTRLFEHLCSMTGPVKVIYISGHADAFAMEVGLLAPGSSFLQKPFERETLLDAVKTALQSQPAQATDGAAAG